LIGLICVFFSEMASVRFSMDIYSSNAFKIGKALRQRDLGVGGN
jgi:hypothetical protein